MSRRRLPLSLLLPLALAVGCSPAEEERTAGVWPQFRGVDGQGISPDEGLPVRWRDGSPNLLWQAPVPGAGNSSPIVSDGKVFLTTTYGLPEDDARGALARTELSRVVLAYDLESGEKLWETVVFTGRRGKRHWSNTHAAPTPVTDGRYVFASFDAHLGAVDFDGNLIWHREVDPEYYEYSHYGVSSSPVLAGDAVILLQDKEEGESGDPGWIAAYDKGSGEELWRDEWTHACCSYVTPLVVERLGRIEVWNTTAGEVVAYDAGSGEKLWRGDYPTMQAVPSIVRDDDLFLAPGGIHRKTMTMFHLCPTEEVVEPLALWSTKEGVPEISTPVLYLGKLYSVTTGGALYARDPMTGDRVWRKRLPTGEYRPSLVAGDGKVYVSNGHGTTVVVDAARKRPRILARNRLTGSGSSASPAIAGGSLLMRGESSLWRIGGGQAAEPEAEDDDEEGEDEAGTGAEDASESRAGSAP